MKYFIFRNNTIEFFFDRNICEFSGYDDISFIPENSEKYIWFYQAPYGIIDGTSVAMIKSIEQKFDFVYSRIPKEKQIYVFTLCDVGSTRIVSGDSSFAEAIVSFNMHVIGLSKKNSNIKIIDFSEFVSYYKKADFIDWKYYFTSQLAFSAKITADFKRWFAQKEEELALKRKKCIVLDLDNTLWGGVLGEDGMEGVKVGGDYPGNAFLYFQKSLVTLSKSGIILAICSKNNEDDVKTFWRENTCNIINEEYISTYRINWANKAENIREIASELNIGLDSLVFIDDSPYERELVKRELPMVEVPDFPKHPYELPVFIDYLVESYFRVYSITNEDKNKTEEYRSNAQRSAEQQKFTDMNSFIQSLNIKLEIHKANKMNISRIAQMTQKTNQFNLTTRRYTEGDLSRMLSEGAKIWCLSVSDKFGDSGITGCVIIKGVEIDEFLMSCRILGKGIEREFISHVLNLLKAAGMEKAYATYIPTAKNAQVKDFYENNGFLVVSEKNGAKKYSINLVSYQLKADMKYKVSVIKD